MKKVIKAPKKKRQATIHPIVKFLESRIPPGRISAVARKAGVVSNSLHNWFSGNAPTIYFLDYALHAIGYRLAVVAINSAVPVAPILPPIETAIPDGTEEEDKTT